MEGVVGVRGGALVGFFVGMGVGTLGAVGCWVFCVIVVYIVEWGKSRGALVWHCQSKGFVVLLSSVGDTWMQGMVQGQFCMC